MSFSNSITSFLTNAFNFRDRASRGEYWYVVLFNMVISFILGCVTYFFAPAKIFDSIYGLIIMIPMLSLITRRLHDIGVSGWLQLITIIPTILMFASLPYLGMCYLISGCAVIILLMTIPSDPFTNKYGPGKVVTDDPGIVANVKYRRILQIYKGQTKLCLITAITSSLLLELAYFSQYFLDPDKYYFIFDNKIGLIINIIWTVISIILDYLILTDKTKDGIICIVCSMLHFGFCVYCAISYFVIIWHRIDSLNKIDMMQIVNYSTPVISSFILFMLCLLSSKRLLRINKLTTALCYSSFIIGLLQTIYQQAYIFSYKNVNIFEGITAYEFLIIVRPMFCLFFPTALLYRFKLRELMVPGDGVSGPFWGNKK